MSVRVKRQEVTWFLLVDASQPVAQLLAELAPLVGRAAEELQLTPLEGCVACGPPLQPSQTLAQQRVLDSAPLGLQFATEGGWEVLNVHPQPALNAGEAP